MLLTPTLARWTDTASQEIKEPGSLNLPVLASSLLQLKSKLMQTLPNWTKNIQTVPLKKLFGTTTNLESKKYPIPCPYLLRRVCFCLR
jgi:hypothetical protein